MEKNPHVKPGGKPNPIADQFSRLQQEAHGWPSALQKIFTEPRAGLSPVYQSGVAGLAWTAIAVVVVLGALRTILVFPMSVGLEQLGELFEAMGGPSRASMFGKAFMTEGLKMAGTLVGVWAGIRLVLNQTAFDFGDTVGIVGLAAIPYAVLRAVGIVLGSLVPQLSYFDSLGLLVFALALYNSTVEIGRLDEKTAFYFVPCVFLVSQAFGWISMGWI